MSDDILCQDLHVGYAKRQVLDALNLQFKPGILYALMGENGSGKSTLVKTIAGLMPARGGQVVWRGRDVTELSARVRAQAWGYLDQQARPHWSMPVQAMVELGTYARRDWSREQAAAAVKRALRQCDCEAIATRPVLELSSGEQQRVLLARMLASEPQVILADEPTAGLDPRHQLAVMELLQAQAKQGRIVIVVMHDMALAARFCDQAVLLHEGRVFAQGQVDAVLDPEHVQRVFGIG
ncbi:ABC transporter ATP-binding protein [Aliidiomarina sp. Khilg15.8]